METNKLIVNKALFKEGSDEECFTRGLAFSEINPNIIYISGGYSDFMNDDGRRSSVFSYNFQKDIRYSIDPDYKYTSSRLLLFDNDSRILISSNFSLGVLNNINNIVELYITPTEYIYSTNVRYIVGNDCFISSAGNKISKFRYDRETYVEKEYYEEIVISPNPTAGSIDLSNEHPAEFSYQLISLAGQVIKSNTLGFISKNSQSSIDISDVPNGQYTLRVYSGREEFAFSIIKEG